jgi:hypothetical protein
LALIHRCRSETYRIPWPRKAESLPVSWTRQLHRPVYFEVCRAQISGIRTNFGFKKSHSRILSQWTRLCIRRNARKEHSVRNPFIPRCGIAAFAAFLYCAESRAQTLYERKQLSKKPELRAGIRI